VTGAAQVLLVDDDPALLEALPEAMRLRLDPIDVDTCDSAVAALERIETRDYDAIVTDIKMPGMDGLALLEHIRQRRPTTPTLLITGHGEDDLAARALGGGAFDYISKPIDRDQFIQSLQAAIETRRVSISLHSGTPGQPNA
jgi:DNA-binding NtrC family response regulator